MRGTRTAVAVLAATVVAGGAYVAAQQQPSTPARGAAPAARPAAQTPTTVGQTPSSGLPLTPTIREHGSSITPAFEGWFHGKDGFDYALAGYFNRNTKEEFDIPVGPNNHIDPGGPDYGQPTHFLLGRQWGVLAIKLPKDFGQKKLVWTLVVNGQTNQITLHTAPVYIVEPYGSSWNNNKPPVLKLSEQGPEFTGPPMGFVASYSATVGQPLPLTAWITDDNVGRSGEPAAADAPAAGAGRAGRAGRAGAGAAAGGAAAPGAAGAAAGGASQPDAPGAAAGGGRGAAAAGRGRGGRGGAAGAAGFGRGPGVSITWAPHRNVPDGKPTFAENKPKVDTANGGKTETTVTFDKPGDYVIRVQGNDSSGEGGGGEQCCWTNGLVKVTVK